MHNHDCTGRGFPWVYSRVWIGESTMHIDCISPKEIKIGDSMTFTMPFTKQEKTMLVSSIQFFGKTPYITYDKDLQNCYYKINLTFMP